MLRAAGFEAYPAMTMAGSRIDYIPADQFNHCVTVVKGKADGKYHLLDPTWVPFVRELWSSAEQQQNYLMGVPEGADLAETPVSNPSNHYLRMSGSTSIAADGTLEGDYTVTAEGQTDASVRSLFTRAYIADWTANVEKEVLLGICAYNLGRGKAAVHSGARPYRHTPAALRLYPDRRDRICQRGKESRRIMRSDNALPARILL